jgi:rod shape-determining protein MreC
MNINSAEVPPERKIIILVAVLFLNLILVSTQVVLKNQKTLFQNVIGFFISPFQIAFQETVDYFSKELRHYVFLKNSFKKYLDLKKKYTRAKYENYLLKRKIEEAEFLKTLKAARDDFIKTEVISVDRNFPFSSIIINKGSSNGIVKNMIVLNREGELVGRVVQPISLFSAKVRLITSTTGGTGAYIDQKEKLEGLLTGNNSTICNFKYLMENKPVKIGDRVITSGTDGIFPPYLPVGKVVKVEKEYLTQIVEVEPYFIKHSIKQLIVINSGLPPETANTGNKEPASDE